MTTWLWQKLDVFLAAAVIALAGITASQSHALLAQYINRLGAEVSEARDHLTDVQTGLRYRVMGDTPRAELETEAQTRFNGLKQAADAVVKANGFTRPLALAHRHDTETLKSAWQNFTPELPVTIGAIAYTFAGMVIGFLIYEIIKAPIVFTVSDSRRRRFRRRG